MDITNLGLLAGALTTASGIPQVVKTYRTRKVRDISLWQPLLLNVGMTLWLVYGIILKDVPLIVANAVSLVCYSMLLIMKFVYRDDDNGRNDNYIVAKTAVKEES